MIKLTISIMYIIPMVQMSRDCQMKRMTVISQKPDLYHVFFSCNSVIHH